MVILLPFTNPQTKQPVRVSAHLASLSLLALSFLSISLSISIQEPHRRPPSSLSTAIVINNDLHNRRSATPQRLCDRNLRPPSSSSSAVISLCCGPVGLNVLFARYVCVHSFYLGFCKPRILVPISTFCNFYRGLLMSILNSCCPMSQLNSGSVCSEPGSSDCKPSKSSLWPDLLKLSKSLSIFETHGEHKDGRKKGSCTKSNGWTSAVKRFLNSGSMWRLQERVLGLTKTGISSSTSDIWLLGVCYKIQGESSSDPVNTNGEAAFIEDFSSRILLTYRKGFAAIGDSKYTSDVNWGCMLRSSQMLIAQALIVHQLGRAWRRAFHKPLDKEYIHILHLFGDSETAPFSIHNLLRIGKSHKLAAGSWVGPYVMCRTWESLLCWNKETELGHLSFPMAIYIVSGDDGERGGAPVVCMEDASRHCFEFSKGQANWAPILLLVPLVLGLDKINTRYIPLLSATFTFPQSLGILGGRSGASTYIVGVQDDEAFYLDPHEVQPVVDIREDNLEGDTSSYHCNVVRHIPLDSIDPSLAIGFYCRDKVTSWVDRHF
ncbi:cysteine protease ATG4-like isoform X3 [Diospyros lotus]|uniref:cysteine protease ATG4-like isoform X3 n=1 Tax=Diospyros lotus TaxID=55363 RepID=UPI00224E3716|nr:cysteine protease ATG4-like isoform X3 [Diospyros lotus]